MRKVMAIIIIIVAVSFVFAAADVAMAMGHHGGGGHGGGHGGGRGGGGCGIPEIDPGMASSAIALLTCGLLILSRRFGDRRFGRT